MRPVIVLLLVSLLFACKQQQTNTVEYSFSMTRIDSIPLLRVHLKCKAEPNGVTTLLYPNNAWGQDSLFNAIQSISVKNTESQYERNPDSGWIVITHPKDLELLELTYELKQDQQKITTRSTYRPIIQNEYFHVFGHNLLMVPRAYAPDSDTSFSVDISWEDMPQDYQMHNSFNSGERSQSLKNISERELSSSVFMGGDFRTHRLRISGNDVFFALRGEWQAFNDQELLEVLRKTIASQRDFMQDHSQSFYAVSIIPIQQKQGSGYQGTGLTNSFAMSATNNAFLELDQLVYLLNHEHQHNWIGHLIKNENEEQQYWFSEGFTDYYTIKNIARNQINGQGASYVLNKMNDVIKELYTSPVKDAPNSDISYDNFWTDYNYNALPYKRGSLFAFILDLKIQQESKGAKSLDDVILAIKKDAEKSGQRISHPYIIETFEPYLKGFENFFRRHIEEGQLIDLSSEFNALGFETVPYAHVYDFGLELSDNDIIIAIDPSSNAYRSGLREGDEIVRQSYVWGDPDHEASVVVKSQEGEKTFRFYPSKQLAITQLELSVLNEQNLNL